ncbi:hypothetical protein [Mesorhizobium sp.]|uniref:hypothetical protein n=1 Tax=Mesorhizobium sp. TaxID=1871066 RepID=UPI0025BD8A26|nr:hypothetical protein [Mesorhizobium sp.]
MPASNQPPIFLDSFHDLLRSRGEAAAQSPETSLARRGGDELFYTPFEQVNPNARIRFHLEGLRADGLDVPKAVSLAEYVEVP